MSGRNNKQFARTLILMLAGAMLAWTQPPVGNGSISGSVTNSITNAPLPRVHVAVIVLTNTGTPSFSATTDAEGKFTIGRLPPGRFIIQLDHVGFVAPSTGNQVSNPQLKPDEKREDVKLALTPTGGISGRVLNAAGGEVQGAIVTVEGGPFGTNPATTDEKGQFRISGLSPGRYRLLANPAVMPFPPEIRTDGTEEVHYARTFYPDALTAKSALRVEVAAGAEVRGIDIRLVRTPIVTLKGKVVDLPAGGKTLVRAVANAGGAVQMANNVKPDGSFEIWQLDPGKYTVVAINSTPGAGSQSSLQSAPVEIDVEGADIGNIELPMIRPFDVMATLGFDDSKAREAGTVSSAPQGPGQGQGQGQAQPPSPQGAPRQPVPRRMNLRPEGQAFVNSSSAYQTVEISDNDSFTVEKVQPGRYRLTPMWGVYIKSVTVGGRDTDGDILDLRNGPPGDVTVTVGSVTGEVSGVVSDLSGPAAGVRVVMIGEGSFGRLPISAMSAADGAYKFAAVPPGRYRLVAGDNEIVNQFRPGMDMEEYADLTESISVHAGDKITQALKKRVSDGR